MDPVRFLPRKHLRIMLMRKLSIKEIDRPFFFSVRVFRFAETKRPKKTIAQCYFFLRLKGYRGKRSGPFPIVLITSKRPVIIRDQQEKKKKKCSLFQCVWPVVSFRLSVSESRSPSGTPEIWIPRENETNYERSGARRQQIH